MLFKISSLQRPCTCGQHVWPVIRVILENLSLLEFPMKQVEQVLGEQVLGEHMMVEQVLKEQVLIEQVEQKLIEQVVVENEVVFRPLHH